MYYGGPLLGNVATCVHLTEIYFCVYQVKKRGKRKVIGVLDIYGFEIFKVQQTVYANLSFMKILVSSRWVFRNVGH